ncbi:MAG: hypothetical protein O9264_13970 [Leptospira sp.]|nr:hypothetical protein [Leptospira sp.]
MKLLKTITCLCLLSINCSSSKNYTKHRIQDFGDTITIGLEKDNVGVSVWVWCLGGGLTNNERSVGIGIRNGHMGIYQAGGYGEIRILQPAGSRSSMNRMGNSNFLINSNQHRPFKASERAKDKSSDAVNMVLFVPIPKIPDSNTRVAHCNSDLTLETSLGLYYGIRLGINLTEIFDLVLGFAKIDLMQDDIDD